MKIWEIVKESFENEKNTNSNLEEGWREMALGGLMTIASLGGKASDKTVNPEPNKIEYSTTANAINPVTITKFKNEYASLLSKKGLIFKKFENYHRAMEYVSSLDVQTIGDKVFVVDDMNNKKLIGSSGGKQEQEVFKIFGQYIINYLKKSNEDKVGQSLYQDIQNEFSKFLQK